jgi:ATP-dependent RNA helicase RhlE
VRISREPGLLLRAAQRSERPYPVTSFADFALLAPLQRALTAEGYTKPTPIQVQAMPHALAGRDLLGIAQTGTGKTAAFALPILHRLGKSGTTRKPKTVRSLILSPTRELASQIAESFRTYGKYMHLSIDVVFGGVPIGKQIRRLTTGADILVATPGRLLDLIEQRAITLRELEILVLDEADQMLDLGFIQPLKRIVPMLPKNRQSLFFSATMPKTIASLADHFLTDPVEVAVAPVATTAERVTQGVMFVPNPGKQALLHAVLQDPAIARVLVFTRTKHGADRVVKHLERDGIPASAIHGNKSQAQRERALGAFRAGQCRVLVATDIAARGIDIDAVTHVINFELPNVPESYVHRIGRTARAGASGIAISFCANDERPFLRDIERLTRLPVPVLAMPEGFVMPRFDKAAMQAEAQEEARERAQRFQQRGPRPQRDGGDGKPRSFRPRSSEEGSAEGKPRSFAPRPQGQRPTGADAPRQDRFRQDRPSQDGQRQDRPQQERSRGPRRPGGNRPQGNSRVA